MKSRLLSGWEHLRTSFGKVAAVVLEIDGSFSVLSDGPSPTEEPGTFSDVPQASERP